MSQRRLGVVNYAILDGAFEIGAAIGFERYNHV